SCAFRAVSTRCAATGSSSTKSAARTRAHASRTRAAWPSSSATAGRCNSGSFPSSEVGEGLFFHDAGVGRVRPLFLHRVGLAVAAGHGSLLAVADVADLAVVRVVPGERLAQHGGEADLGVGDGLDHLVRGDRALVGDRDAVAAYP